MLKKNIYIIILALLVTSCAGTFDSVKRGLTGAKGDTADEFLVKKKDPLILPPDYENLPSPEDRKIAKESVKSFEETLKKVSSEANTSESSKSSSTEKSILKKIQNK